MSNNTLKKITHPIKKSGVGFFYAHIKIKNMGIKIKGLLKFYLIVK